MFSSRTNWQSKPNRLTELLSQLQGGGSEILDLTISNPTLCGIEYPRQDILAALSTTRSLDHDPDPRGLLTAREAVCAYYRAKRVTVAPDHVFLTASTSEAYATVFRLLCDTWDEVLIPKPSYPLFDYLAQISDVRLNHYSLRYDGEWHIDFDSLIKSITPKTKAITVINPHNPTGMFLKRKEYENLVTIATGYNLALIVDEVFLEYGFDRDAQRAPSTAGESRVLTFTMNGISKMLGLPQMKLGWIVLGGPKELLTPASQRLEIICDTFLSVNTPVQAALPEHLRSGRSTCLNIKTRTRNNFAVLTALFGNNGNCSVVSCEGGWYGILRVPNVKSDEEWCLELLAEQHVYLYPGYFFDFENEGYLVVSLLTEETVFHEAAIRIQQYLAHSIG